MKQHLVHMSLIVVLAAGLLACSKRSSLETTFILHGYTGTVQTVSSNARYISQASGILSKNLDVVIKAMDDHQPGNEIAKLNRVGDAVRLPVSQLTFRAIDLARYYNELTAGAYDITLSDVARLWTRGTPGQDQLEEALRRTGARHIEASDNNTIAFLVPGIRITTGLLAPAYAVDAGIVEMRRMVSGPVLFTLNSFARQEGVFTDDPRPTAKVSPPGFPILGAVDLHRHRSLVVLGLQQDTPGTNRPTSQLRIDPRSGQPASGALAVAVTGPLTVKAYALAEALLVLGIEDGKTIMKNFPEYDVMIITLRRPIIAHATPGFQEVFYRDELSGLEMRDWVIPEESSDLLQLGERGPTLIEGLPDDSANQIFVSESD